MTTFSGCRRGVSLGAGILLLGALACGKASDSDLHRDLDLAGGENGLELAPVSNRTEVISASERFPNTRNAPAPAQRSVESRPSVTSKDIAPKPAPEPQVQTPEELQPKPSAPAEGSVRPRPNTPSKSGPPPGGYKTVEEVIRNAPFPINP
jgi:hypothetical protein